MARVGIFGAGWVGLVTGACFAELGHEVVVRDVVAEKVEALERGEVPFHETDVPELLQRNGARIRFTLDAGELASCRFLFVCVDTPPTRSGDADLSRVWRVSTSFPSWMANDPRDEVDGSGRHRREDPHGLNERGLANVGYVSNPEFLAEGTAVRDFMHPDRIAVGAFEPEDGDAVAALYDALEAPIVRCDVNSAEMIKLAANAALMTGSRSSTRSPTSARPRAPTSRRSPRAWASTGGSGPTSCGPASATAAAASRRTRWR